MFSVSSGWMESLTSNAGGSEVRVETYGAYVDSSSVSHVRRDRVAAEDFDRVLFAVLSLRDGVGAVVAAVAKFFAIAFEGDLLGEHATA